MKRLMILCTVALVLAMAAGCKSKNSSDVDPSIPFYQDYKVIWRHWDNLTKAKATFRIGNADGSLLKLTSPAVILCNNERSAWSNVGSYFYNWQHTGMVDIHFDLTDNMHRTMHNTLLTTDANPFGFPYDLHQVNLNGGTPVKWAGYPVGSGEFITAMLIQGERCSGLWYVDSIGSDQMELSAELMYDLQPGDAYLLLIRETTLNTVAQQDETAGGRRIIVQEVRQTVRLVRE